jgi:2-isopropylmalate synthase
MGRPSDSLWLTAGFMLIAAYGAGQLPDVIDGVVEHVVSEGDGQVNALDIALRKSLDRFYPNLRDMHLIDYKVRVVNAKEATAARVRVVIESRDKDKTWGTVGVSENVIDASWKALVDSVEYKLLKDADKDNS